MMGGCCGTRRGSRGRWRKPLRTLVHGKGPEDGSVRRQPSVAGRPGCWASRQMLFKMGIMLFFLTKRKRVNNARDWNNGWLQKYF